MSAIKPASAAAPRRIGSHPMLFGAGPGTTGATAAVTGAGGGGAVTGKTHPGVAVCTAAEAAATAAVDPAQTAVLEATLPRALSETSGSTLLTGAEGAA
jgi:hypothetical protein